MTSRDLIRQKAIIGLGNLGGHQVNKPPVLFDSIFDIKPLEYLEYKLSNAESSAGAACRLIL